MDYENYVKDFPCRILKLYENLLGKATHARLEVTFLLSLTASGIAVPLDRLRPDPKKNRQYPDPFEDRNTFKEAAKKFDTLYEEPFRESKLWDPCFKEWQYGRCRPDEIDPYLWEAISSTCIVKKVIEHLRDSLAHGIIRTRGNEGKEIKEILLFKGKKKEGLRVLRMTPHSLGIFLCNWIDWLQTLDVSIWPKSSSQVKSEQ